MKQGKGILDIPGPRAAPVIGHTLDVMRDAIGFCSRVEDEYGPVYKIHNLGEWRVYLGGPDALEFVLNDREQLFSVKQGWEMIDRLFSGGVLLRDFDDHREHRRILQSAFRAKAVENYVARMTREVDRQIARWPIGQDFLFYPRVKNMMMSLSAAIFLGVDPDSSMAREFTRLATLEANAIVGIVRRPLPFTAMGRGVAARRSLDDMLFKLIPERRRDPRTDFFSQMCTARDEDGIIWTDKEIVDHFNFLLAASHDTIASTLSMMAWLLGKHPYWQDRLSVEAVRFGKEDRDTRSLSQMNLTDCVFREALRIMPPVPFILRRAMREFWWRGHRIPTGTWIYVSPALVMRDPKIFPNPLQFDPMRFSETRAEGRVHKFAFAPFGGGAHKCMGMHFSALQVKVVLSALLKRGRIELAPRSGSDWQHVPVPKPRDGLPLRLRHSFHDRSELSFAAA